MVGFNSSARWILECCAHTASAKSRNSLGTRMRSHNDSMMLSPVWQCNLCLGHSEGGVTPFPKSCTCAAKRTRRESESCAACLATINV
ncbi:Uncharacterised protein [Vibrio cholerae]|nr:Uncharacterised protein [Vibrio cholerae]